VETANIESTSPEVVGNGLKRWPLVVGHKMMLYIYELEEGASFPCHNHVHEEVKYILSGKLELKGPRGSQVIETGTACVIHSNELHGAYAPGPGPATYINIFSPVREDFVKKTSYPYNRLSALLRCVCGHTINPDDDSSNP
jgi:quercetin dioxygenase-like cupin family protein